MSETYETESGTSSPARQPPTVPRNSRASFGPVKEENEESPSSSGVPPGPPRPASANPGGPRPKPTRPAGAPMARPGTANIRPATAAKPPARRPASALPARPGSKKKRVKKKKKTCVLLFKKRHLMPTPESAMISIATCVVCKEYLEGIDRMNKAEALCVDLQKQVEAREAEMAANKSSAQAQLEDVMEQLRKSKLKSDQRQATVIKLQQQLDEAQKDQRELEKRFAEVKADNRQKQADLNTLQVGERDLWGKLNKTMDENREVSDELDKLKKEAERLRQLSEQQAATIARESTAREAVDVNLQEALRAIRELQDQREVRSKQMMQHEQAHREELKAVPQMFYLPARKRVGMFKTTAQL